MKVVERLVQGAKAYDDIKKDCKGFLSYNISPNGEIQVYLTVERFKNLFELYKVEENYFGIILVREIDNVKFIAQYCGEDKENEDF